MVDHINAPATGESASASYDELRVSMLARHGELSRQLQKIARFALDHPDVVALETVTTVAQRADVQPSAIVRFAKAFGYDGFSGLQKVFRHRLMANNVSYRDRIKSMADKGRSGVASLLDNFAKSAIDSLWQLQVRTQPEKLEQAIALLKNANDIHLLGQRRSFAVVQYLHYALSRLERRCFLADGAGGMLDHQMARCSRKDVVIAVSFATYSQSVVDTVKRLTQNGVPVIAITDSPLSPLAPASKISIEITSENSEFRSLVAPMCLAQTLVVGLGQALSPAPNVDSGHEAQSGD